MGICRSQWSRWIPWALAFVLCCGVQAAPGEFEAHQDIGAPRLKGNATYDAVSQTYRLSAGGANMWGSRDEFHFAWQRLRGDFILQARVEFQGRGIDPHRKAGLIVRSSLDDDAAYVDGVVHGDGLVSLQWRRSKAAATQQMESPATGADVLQLERRGTTYIFSAAKHGEGFKTVQVADIDLGDMPHVGLALCSHNADVTERAIFRNVRIIRPAKADFVPYRDYIGSHLELLEIDTGYRQVLYSSKQPFEAPNWTPDGTALIYNTSGSDPEHRGRLYRFDLATRKASRIDTGFAIRNNNDHVLSFDGSMLGISDQSTAKGESTIYTLPSSGGVPKRITPRTPSYLHGWSPDGRWLVYTGIRDGDADIYRIAAAGGGAETRLTTAKGVDDGPEYSPDGRFIYFNSMRNGRMQIFRMNADATDQQALTNDEYNNWFPHVSPDGKWLSIISYVDAIAPSDHPYYKRVYLRLMPAQGGPARVIAYVYGGQGTINVPSWSPDGRRLAFVSNSDISD